MAPAKRASIAEGPALKLVHCTLTCGPMAFSKKPLALPTMACACVMLGNAPTRMVLGAPCAKAAIAEKSVQTNPMIFLVTVFLVSLGASDHHGQNAGGILRLLSAQTALGGSRVLVDNKIRESGVVENVGGRVTDVQKYLVESSVREITVNEFAQVVGVAKRGEGTVDESDNLTEANVGGFAAEAVSSLGAADAIDQAGILEF